MLRLLALCFALVIPLTARALGPDQEREPQGYRAAIDAAVQEHELNHFAESREHFARAHALYPNARTLRGLGVADFELRHYVDAVNELEAALAASSKRLEGALRRDTEELLSRARAYVGEIQLTLEPPTAAVTVDGVAMQLGAHGSLVLEVGDHVLEASATGHITQRRPLRVSGQQRSALSVVLPAATTPQSATATTESTRPAKSGSSPPPASRRRVVTWVLGGLTLAAAGSVVGLALAVENTEDSFQACLADNGLCQPLADKGTRLERARNAMIGVASAAALATLVSFFVEGRAKRKNHVAVGVSGTGVRVVGTF